MTLKRLESKPGAVVSAAVCPGIGFPQRGDDDSDHGPGRVGRLDRVLDSGRELLGQAHECHKARQQQSEEHPCLAGRWRSGVHRRGCRVVHRNEVITMADGLNEYEYRPQRGRGNGDERELRVAVGAERAQKDIAAATATVGQGDDSLAGLTVAAILGYGTGSCHETHSRWGFAEDFRNIPLFCAALPTTGRYT